MISKSVADKKGFPILHDRDGQEPSVTGSRDPILHDRDGQELSISDSLASLLFDKFWANEVLRSGFLCIKRGDRLGVRRNISLLDATGYWWQLRTLRRAFRKAESEGYFTTSQGRSST